MIALSAPWALLGLLALPVLVWLHRRRRRAVAVDVPSVLFLEAEAAEALAPERMRLDAELLLAIAAASLVALAAAGPRVASSPAGRVVRVVVDNGPSMEAKPADGESALVRATRAWTGIRDRLLPGDRLEAMPGHGGRDGLLSLTRAGNADLRVVVSDRRMRPEPPDVVVVCVGDPAAKNVGIVAATVEVDGAAARAFVNVLNAGASPAHVRLGLTVPRDFFGDRTLDLEPGQARSETFALPAGTLERVQFDLSPGDDLALDDDATLVRRPFRVAFAAGAGGYPEPYRRAVLEGLGAILGPSLEEERDLSGTAGARFPSGLDLFVGEPAAAPRGIGASVLALSLVPAGEPGVRVPAALVFPAGLAPEDALLDPTGCDLVFPGVAEGGGPRSLVDALPGGVSGWRFRPDPLAGSPAPVDHPLWPLFLDAVVSRIRGREVAPGWRLARGTLDPEVTRLGRDVVPFDAAALARIAPARRPQGTDLRLLLIAAGAVCLGLLWVGPAVLRRPRVP